MAVLTHLLAFILLVLGFFIRIRARIGKPIACLLITTVSAEERVFLFVSHFKAVFIHEKARFFVVGYPEEVIDLGLVQEAVAAFFERNCSTCVSSVLEKRAHL